MTALLWILFDDTTGCTRVAGHNGQCKPNADAASKAA